jgi:NAD(P)H-dependent FMN reductase
MAPRVVRVLAISGSLRARSSNTEVLRAAAALAPPDVAFTFYEGLATLPHFNPDLDGIGAEPMEPVATLRRAVWEADALLISSPEYAHGIVGSLKNALDWLVSGDEIPGKPVGLFSTSTHSRHAPASLAEILRTMSAQVVEGACTTIPIDGRRLDAAAIVADPALASLIAAALASLLRAADHHATL